jgi:hypothetical protein
MLRVVPSNVSTVDQAATAHNLMDWAVNSKMYSDLTREVELLSQYLWTYGWTGVHISWQQEMGQKEQELTRLTQVMETTKPRVGASAGARRPIFVKKRHENGHGHASDKENTTPSQPTEIKDMSLSCAKCRRTWVWTPGSQAFYKREDKGTPKYCPGCR